MAFKSEGSKTVEKEHYWRRHHSEWETSGLSQPDYCKREGISLHTFRNWRRKLTRKYKDSGVFVELAQKASPSNKTLSESYIELDNPAIGVLRIPDSINPELLRHITACTQGDGMIFVDLTRISIFVRPGSTDFRKSVDGLASLTQEVLRHSPMSGNLYVFCNRQRNRLKVLYWEQNGFCLWYKRLDEGKFPWPKSE